MKVYITKKVLGVTSPRDKSRRHSEQFSSAAAAVPLPRSSSNVVEDKFAFYLDESCVFDFALKNLTKNDFAAYGLTKDEFTEDLYPGPIGDPKRGKRMALFDSLLFQIGMELRLCNTEFSAILSNITTHPKDYIFYLVTPNLNATKFSSKGKEYHRSKEIKVIRHQKSIPVKGISVPIDFRNPRKEKSGDYEPNQVHRTYITNRDLNHEHFVLQVDPRTKDADFGEVLQPLLASFVDHEIFNAITPEKFLRLSLPGVAERDLPYNQPAAIERFPSFTPKINALQAISQRLATVVQLSTSQSNQIAGLRNLLIDPEFVSEIDERKTFINQKRPQLIALEKKLAEHQSLLREIKDEIAAKKVNLETHLERAYKWLIFNFAIALYIGALHYAAEKICNEDLGDINEKAESILSCDNEEKIKLSRTPLASDYINLQLLLVKREETYVSKQSTSNKLHLTAQKSKYYMNQSIKEFQAFEMTMKSQIDAFFNGVSLEDLTAKLEKIAKNLAADYDECRNLAAQVERKFILIGLNAENQSIARHRVTLDRLYSEMLAQVGHHELTNEENAGLPAAETLAEVNNALTIARSELQELCNQANLICTEALKSTEASLTTFETRMNVCREAFQAKQVAISGGINQVNSLLKIYDDEKAAARAKKLLAQQTARSAEVGSTVASGASSSYAGNIISSGPSSSASHARSIPFFSSTQNSNPRINLNLRILIDTLKDLHFWHQQINLNNGVEVWLANNTAIKVPLEIAQMLALLINGFANNAKVPENFALVQQISQQAVEQMGTGCCCFQKKTPLMHLFSLIANSPTPDSPEAENYLTTGLAKIKPSWDPQQLDDIKIRLNEERLLNSRRPIRTPQNERTNLLSPPQRALANSSS